MCRKGFSTYSELYGEGCDVGFLFGAVLGLSMAASGQSFYGQSELANGTDRGSNALSDSL